MSDQTTGPSMTLRDLTFDEVSKAAHRTLRTAADLINKRGWRNHAGNGEPKGPLCMMAAIGEASIDYPSQVHGVAYVSIKRLLGIPHPEGSLSEWNDKRCRDQDEVVRVLREAADKVHEEYRAHAG
jgi:hypothetical protein